MEYLGNNKPVNTTKPLVSVCITAYQHAGFIKKCLESILSQETDFPFEVIVGEDESSDGTREICMELAKKFPDKIRLFLRTRDHVIYINGQPSGRYNYLENLKAARGDYIAFCDGDDYWTDNRKLQRQVDLFRSDNRLTFVFHKAHKIDDDGKIIDPLPEKVPPMKNDFVNKSYFVYRGPHYFATSSMCVTRRVIEQLPGWVRWAPGGDMFVSLLAATYGNLGYIDKAMSVYRYSFDRGWRSQSYKSLSTVIRLILLNIRTYLAYLVWGRGKNLWPVSKIILLQIYMMIKHIVRRA